MPTAWNHRILRVASIVWLTAVLACSTLDAGTPYGTPLTGREARSPAELLDGAAELEGQLVRVEGVVTGVCEMRGCWMALVSVDGDDPRSVRVKVEDDVIVFPKDALGKRAVAEGELERIELSLEKSVRYEQHLAEERGEVFDPTTVTEPLVFHQLRGTGAVIFD